MTARREPAPCPAAALAHQAANIIRALHALAPPDERQDDLPEAVPCLLSMVEGRGHVDVEIIRTELNSELVAILEFAPCVVATSHRGAVFQAYVIGAEAEDPIIITLGGLSPSISYDLKAHCHRQERAWHSIRAAIDGRDDPDLAMVHSWLFPAGEAHERLGRTIMDELDRLKAA